MKLLSILLPLVAFLLAGETKTDQRYFILLYTGDEPKPVPILFFHLKGSTDTALDKSNAYVKKFEISESDFDYLTKEILATQINTSEKEVVVTATYQIRIINNKEFTILNTQYLFRIEKIFSLIKRRLQNSKDRIKIEHELNAAFDRLKRNRILL